MNAPANIVQDLRNLDITSPESATAALRKLFIPLLRAHTPETHAGLLLLLESDLVAALFEKGTEGDPKADFENFQLEVLRHARRARETGLVRDMEGVGGRPLKGKKYRKQLSFDFDKKSKNKK